MSCLGVALPMRWSRLCCAFAGNPATLKATSPSKPAARFTFTTKDASLPGATGVGGSSFAVNWKGARSITAKVAWFSQLWGGNGKLAIPPRITPNMLAALANFFPFTSADPSTSKG